jgi:hypothetical protein
MDKEWIKLVGEIEAKFGIESPQNWSDSRKRLLKRFRDVLQIKLKEAVLEEPSLAVVLNDKTPNTGTSKEEIAKILATFRVNGHYEFDLRTLQTALDVEGKNRNVQKRTQNAFAIFCGYKSYLDYVSKGHLKPQKKEEIPSKTQQFEDEVFLNFQNRFVEIQRDWSIEVNQKDWKPSKKEIRAIERYWYLVFDEWFFCTQRNKSLNKLWDNHYKSGVIRAFFNAHFKKRLEYLISLNEFSQDFKETMNGLCLEALNEKLK